MEADHLLPPLLHHWGTDLNTIGLAGNRGEDTAESDEAARGAGKKVVKTLKTTRLILM